MNKKLGMFSVFVLQGMAVIAQGGQFFLLAHACSAYTFGQYSKWITLANFFIPFVGMGLGNYAILRSTGASAASRRFAYRHLLVVLISAVVLGAVAGVVIYGKDKEGLFKGVGLLLFSELFVAKLSDAVWHYLVANGLSFKAALVSFIGCASRFAVGVFLLILGYSQNHPIDFLGVVSAYAITNCFAAAVSMMFLKFIPSHSGLDNTLSIWEGIKIGFTYSLTLSSRALLLDADKYRLSTLAPAVAGDYVFAARMFQFIYLPCNMAIQAYLRRLGALSKQGPSAVLRLFMAVHFFMVLVTLVLGPIVYFFASYIIDNYYVTYLVAKSLLLFFVPLPIFLISCTVGLEVCAFQEWHIYKILISICGAAALFFGVGFVFDFFGLTSILLYTYLVLFGVSALAWRRAISTKAV